MQAQIFNFAPIEDLLLVKLDEIKKEKKLAEDLDMA